MNSTSTYLFLIALWACATPGMTRQERKTYEAGINAWHAKRIVDLKAPDGWLNLAGLHWLSPGKNTFGSAEDNTIIFPQGKIAAHAGYFIAAGGTVTLTAFPEAAILHQGKPVTELVMFPAAAQPVKATSGTLIWNIIKRDTLLGIRLRDTQSEVVKNFTGIGRFPIDPAYRVTASFEKAAAQRTIPITNIVGQTTSQPSPGTLVFTLHGQQHRLDVLEEGDEFFIVFADATTGKETYGGGRFVYTQRPDSTGTTVLDFNKAYNPPCVFTPYATCPLPPRQNKLTIAIRAGEKNVAHH